MTNHPPISVTDVYTEYIRLRQNGWTVEDAVRDLRTLADQLGKNERDQLNRMVKRWETRSDHSGQESHTHASAPPPVKSLPRQVKRSVIRPIRPPRPGLPASNPQGISSVAGFGDAAPAGKQYCPECGKLNDLAANYCYACGHMLQMLRGGSTRGLSGGDEIDPHTRWGTAYFGPLSRIVLLVRGAARPIDVQIADNELVLGRSSPESAIRPDIDLAQFNAEALGVSRLHASIKRAEHTVHISDLSSKNHTYINGQRLYPCEVRVLRDGDEIRLGKLSMRVAFKHSER